MARDQSPPRFCLEIKKDVSSEALGTAFDYKF